ncbi:hypothetical protein ACH4UM_13020 [Streptomyces sp. NPDC020801]|uniref:AMP-binding enzyme n=1 Tax=unclassified Streptomyces TaxID=2593676 RepID=UPI0037A1C695
MMRHLHVANVAVVAMPEKVLGEWACAHLVMEPGVPALTVASLGRLLLKQGRAKYKLPERVEIVASLPLSNIGKVSSGPLPSRPVRIDAPPQPRYRLGILERS